MTLEDLLRGFSCVSVTGDSRTEISGISVDSRHIKPKDLFVALQGEKTTGTQFLQEVITKGAAAVVVEEPVCLQAVPVVLWPRVRPHVGFLASRIYGVPSRDLTVVGITGTNGKTTTAHIVESMVKAHGGHPSYVGTLGYRWNKTVAHGDRTSPEATELHEMLKAMREENVSHLVMECSSHGLELGRLHGVELDVAVFLNLTQDHLDFHHTLARYKEAKWKLFSEILAQSSKPDRTAIFNVDDPWGNKWARETDAFRVITFSSRAGSKATVVPTMVSWEPSGLKASIAVDSNIVDIHSSLVGNHNLSNICAAMAVGLQLGLDMDSLCNGIQALHSVPGRLESIANSQGIHVFVDYAHTEDALKHVMESLVVFQKTGKLWVVFGCGGDRDKSKRPLMGNVVAERADFVLVTSDNPRTEDPKQIIRDILAGMPSSVSAISPAELDRNFPKTICSLADRREAIEKALALAQPGDVVLIAGKGHETVQDIQGIKHPFDDREIVRNWFSRRHP